MTYSLRTLCTTLFLTLSAAPVFAALDSTQDRKDAPLVQVFIGVLELDNQTAEWNDIYEDTVDVDFSSLPGGGIEAEYVFGRGWVHWGLNPGASVAWKNDDTNISGTLTEETGGTLRVNLDNSLLLVELHLGGYVRGRLHDRVTTYAAAGPMVMYGSHDINDESVEGSTAPPPDGSVNIPDSSSSDTNIGYYARVGIDFEIAENQHLGFGVRYMSTELDFNQTVGKLDIKGPQYVLTLTSQL
jgi:opacity protein-like surface antigen